MSEPTIGPPVVGDVNRKPTALAYKTWLFVGALPYVLGWFSLPPSLEAGPRIFGVAAVWCIAVGAGISLLGLLWRVRNLTQKLNSVVIEAVGLVGIGAGLLLYAVALATSDIRNVERGNVFLALSLCLAVSTSAAFQIREHLRYRNAHFIPAPEQAGHGH